MHCKSVCFVQCSSRWLPTRCVLTLAWSFWYTDFAFVEIRAGALLAFRDRRYYRRFVVLLISMLSCACDWMIALTVCVAVASDHHKHVHGRRKDFFLGGTKGVFQIFSRGGGKSGEICFFPLKTKKTTLFCWKCQSPGVARPPFRRPWARVCTKTVVRKSSIGGLYVCTGGRLGIKIWQKFHWFIMFHISTWGS